MTTEQEQQQHELMVQKRKLAQDLGLVLPKNIGDKVLNSLNTSIDSGNFQVPDSYHLGNALKSAYTIIANDNKIMATDDVSKANALVQMAVLGLSPAKKQVYFVPMGNKCTLMTSYFGKVAGIKRLKGVVDVKCDVIYDATEYTLAPDDWGNTTISIEKVAPLEILGEADHIIGAWAKIILDPKVWGTDSFTTIMNMKQIRNAWSQGNGGGKTMAHLKFTDEMAKKTVINRAIKMFVNTSDDSDLISGALNQVAENEVEVRNYEVVEEEKAESLQKQEISFEDKEADKAVEVKEKPKKAAAKTKEVKEDVIEATIIEPVESEINIPQNDEPDEMLDLGSLDI